MRRHSPLTAIVAAPTGCLCFSAVCCAVGVVARTLSDLIGCGSGGSRHIDEDRQTRIPRHSWIIMCENVADRHSVTVAHSQSLYRAVLWPGWNRWAPYELRPTATRTSSAPSWDREHPLWDSLPSANVTGVLLAFVSLKLISLGLELCQHSELSDLQIRNLR